MEATTQFNVRLTYSFGFLLLLSLKSLVIKAQSPNYMGDDCHNSTHKPLSSSYQSNLNRVLTWLSSDAATSKGYNHKSIGSNIHGDHDAVYGLYDCRGDVVGYFCQFCVSTATREVLQRCPNRVSAVIWYDFCILRYSNKDFFGNVTIYPTWNAVGTQNVSNSVEIQKGEDFMRSLIRKATVETNQLFYMDGFNLNSTQRRYGLVQCSRDLTNDGCRQCLEAMLAQVPKCCEQKIAWFIGSASCLMKHEGYMFYLFHNYTSLGLAPNLQTGIELKKIASLINSVHEYPFGFCGYMAPEYAMEGLFSVKSDVFSFGVLVLEIIHGKKNSGFYLSDSGQSLLIHIKSQGNEDFPVF
ncbi:hypothetical protein VNO77_39273 [Canavalia gladiata]|uniref:Gnk2-homologous domain-containing protein n=1 Tax=Canavalia gladiata TaxID=3824 RepID=A0AAN9KE42_CANGL